MIDSNESVQSAIDGACAELELTVKDMGVNLAFAPSNISELEEVLMAVRDMGDESALAGACFMAGAYVGEILRRAIGGQWGMSADGVASLQFLGWGQNLSSRESTQVHPESRFRIPAMGKRIRPTTTAGAEQASFRERLTAVRKAAGFTQVELEAELGMYQRTARWPNPVRWTP